MFGADKKNKGIYLGLDWSGLKQNLTSLKIM